ncbi:hypothetical protein KIPB_009023, partial [Kipferlia bialata]
VQSFDASAFSTHIDRVTEYMPSTLATSHDALRECLAEIPEGEGEDTHCFAERLLGLYTPFSSALTLCSDIETSVEYLQTATTLLSSISSVRVIPLPSDTLALSNKGQLKYIEADEFNTGVRVLFKAARSLIESEAMIEEVLSGYMAVDTPDVKGYRETDALARDALERLGCPVSTEAEDPESKDAESAEGLETVALSGERERSLAVEKGHVLTLFSFWCEASSVSLVGTFNDWDCAAAPMHREGEHWTLSLPLPPGVYLYKYVVDGEWRVSLDHPTSIDSEGNTNNCIEVHKE